MTNEVSAIALALLTGAGLGVVFFGGLWLTLLKLPTTRWPILLALGSMIGRMCITILGFYLISDRSWQQLVACVAGFILARQLLIRRLRPVSSGSQPIKQL